MGSLAFLIEMASENLVHLYTSELTLAEVLVGPLKQSQPGLAKFYEEMLVSDDYLTVVPVGRDVLRRSADIRATTASKGADAIHVATAMYSTCTLFISSDKRIRLPNGMTRIDIDQVEDLDVWT
ncbi:type II toxin-antitoxin system VapC family toxin [Bosea vaviloviae]|uniref:type II toxin-antitoxin system VapC family toxin n=1 Tax=Bosea vaviloviae TaxID=1526658 RepID=UPI001FCDD12C|nr:PIN domain-containing protein [Bosea vaviloviae]